MIIMIRTWYQNITGVTLRLLDLGYFYFSSNISLFSINNAFLIKEACRIFIDGSICLQQYLKVEDRVCIADICSSVTTYRSLKILCPQ